jgi:hypothetical protein
VPSAGLYLEGAFAEEYLPRFASAHMERVVAEDVAAAVAGSVETSKTADVGHLVGEDYQPEDQRKVGDTKADVVAQVRVAELE